MSDLRKLLRGTVRALEAYVPPKLAPPVRMDRNEAPSDVDPAVKREALAALAAADWSVYPGAEAQAFAAELAQVDGWREDGVLLGNGSNEILQVLILAALEPGARVVLAAPSFALYGVQSRAHGATVVEVPLRAGAGQPFRFQAEEFIAAARGAALVLVAAPNNPTGTRVSANDVARLHDETECLVVVDEAYREFAGQDLVPLLATRERLALMRTFSKAQAAAGLRLGYLLAHPWLVAELRKVQMPYNLGLPGAALGRRLLAHRAESRARVEAICAERERLARLLAAVPGVTVHASGGNFLMFETSFPGTVLRDAIAARGVLVRDLSGYPGLGRALRVTAGKPENGDLFLRALQDALAQLREAA